MAEDVGWGPQLPTPLDAATRLERLERLRGTSLPLGVVAPSRPAIATDKVHLTQRSRQLLAKLGKPDDGSHDDDADYQRLRQLYQRPAAADDGWSRVQTPQRAIQLYLPEGQTTLIPRFAPPPPDVAGAASDAVAAVRKLAVESARTAGLVVRQLLHL